MLDFGVISSSINDHPLCAKLMPDYKVIGNILYFCDQPERILTDDQAALLKECSDPNLKQIDYNDYQRDKQRIAFLFSLATLGYVALKPLNRPIVQTSPKVLIFSPHMDDAFLSLGGFISGYSDYINFQIIDFFGDDPWRTFHERFWPQKEQINQLRKNEEFFSAWMCNCNIRIWDHISSPQRGHQVWNGDYNPALDISVKEELTRKIVAFLDENEYDAVLWPLGVGGHVDHRLIKIISYELFQNKHLVLNKFAYYEDLPYSASKNHWQTWPPHYTFSENTPYYIPLKSNLNYKRHILDVYKSQLNPYEAFMICEYARFGSMFTGVPIIDQLHVETKYSKDDVYERIWYPRSCSVDFNKLLGIF